MTSIGDYPLDEGVKISALEVIFCQHDSFIDRLWTNLEQAENNSMITRKANGGLQRVLEGLLQGKSYHLSEMLSVLVADFQRKDEGI